MELKFVIPNMEKTFGNLEFAGEDKVVQRRINGRLTVLSRSYNLYSDVQRADDIVVVLPAEAGEKHFGFEERVKLVNPRITAEGYKIGTRGFTNYLLHADDMIKAAQIMYRHYGCAILLKGGHATGNADDLLYDGTVHWFRASRINCTNTHGTGCTLSSACLLYTSPSPRDA